MQIYVVKKGDTLGAIAKDFRVPLGLLAVWNALTPPYPLIIGQALLILKPRALYTVRQGDTIRGIARRFGLSVRTLLANNPALRGGTNGPFAGQTLVLSWAEPRTRAARINSYAYPGVSEELLDTALPYLSYLAPFTYGFTEEGELISPEDERLIRAARRLGTDPLMHLSTLTEDGGFSNALASALFKNEAARRRLLGEILDNLREKRYTALDIDFEFVLPEEAEAYASFIREARDFLRSFGYPVIAALAPKIAFDQKGASYEGHDYGLIGEAADAVFVMTYEWGYTYGPPLAVAPLDAVRQVLDYAVSEIPAEKIYMGLPNYGYDWTLPYKAGESRARSIGNEEAIALARRVGAEIRFDETAMTPYFFYREDGRQHEVWFEDARSWAAKIDLIEEYGFLGAGIWNIMRPFTAGFLLLQTKYRIED